ncbi:MAG: carbohydrate ABC transporter permease [Chloroflexota bacterium]|nr:carbohydrate ABC transporter permease [Chloroflexota bacterium]
MGTFVGTGLPWSRRAIGSLLQYGLLLGLAALTVFPFLWMVTSSLKSDLDVFAIPPTLLPRSVVWDAYPNLFKLVPFATYAWNSTKIAVLVVIGQMFLCSLAGYGFARLRFPGSTVCFALLMGALMVPEAVTIIPRYLLFRNLGMLDSHWPLILPPAVANSFGTFLMRQFFMTIPKDLEEAARLDGAGYFGIYWRIMLPLSKPALAALAILAFLASWNNFFGALIYLNTEELYTLPIGLATLVGEYQSEWPEVLAGAGLSMAPIFLVYVFAQRRFVEGIAFSGTKG